jgi:hypothetical protein
VPASRCCGCRRPTGAAADVVVGVDRASPPHRWCMQVVVGGCCVVVATAVGGHNRCARR